MRFFFDMDDETERKEYNGTIWIFLIITTFLTTLLISLFGKPVFEGIFENISFHPYINVVIWTLFFVIFSEIPMTLYIARKEPIPYISLQLINFVMNMIFIIYFVAYRGEGALGSIKGVLVSSIILSGIYIFVTSKEIKITFHTKKLYDSLVFGLPLVAHTLSHWALDLSDRLILTKFVSMESIGIYALGYKFGTILRILSISINKAIVPYYYETIPTINGKKKISKLVTYYIGVISVFALLVSVLSKDIILLIANPSYYSSYKVVPIVTGGYLMLALYLIPVNGLFFLKKTKIIPLITGISVLFNIIFNLIMIPKYGIIAAAYATLFSYSILFILIGVISQAAFPLPYEKRRIVKIIFSSVIVYLFCWKLEIVNIYLSLLIKILILTVGFIVLLYLLRFFTINEKRQIKYYFNKR